MKENPATFLDNLTFMTKKTLHIALVHGWFPPIASYGGIIRYIVALAKGYTALGHKVTVITRDDTYPRTDIWEGVTVHRVAVYPNPVLRCRQGRNLFDGLAASAAYAAKIRTVNREMPIDLVEFTNYAAEGFFHSFRQAVPHFTRVSTMGWQSQEINNELLGRKTATLGDRWRNWCEEVPVRRSNFLITPTRAHAEVVQKRYGPQLKVQPIFHGVEMQNVASPPRLSDGIIEFLFVGKMDPRKGFEVLLEAFAVAFQQLGGYIRLNVIGTDSNLAPDGGSFKAYALMGIPDAVRKHINFLGWVSDEKITALYNHCDVFVAPSRYESFGLIYLEAMQMGKAVIGGNTGGVPEVVKHGKTGLLVLPGDINALADAMQLLAQDHEMRKQLGAAGLALWNAEFTEQKACERSLEFYSDCIENV